MAITKAAAYLSCWPQSQYFSSRRVESVIVDARPGVLLRFDRQVSILVVEDVVVQYIIVASLFFEKFPVDVHVLFAGVDPAEISAAFVF